MRCLLIVLLYTLGAVCVILPAVSLSAYVIAHAAHGEPMHMLASLWMFFCLGIGMLKLGIKIDD